MDDTVKSTGETGLEIKTASLNANVLYAANKHHVEVNNAYVEVVAKSRSFKPLPTLRTDHVGVQVLYKKPRNLEVDNVYVEIIAPSGNIEAIVDTKALLVETQVLYKQSNVKVDTVYAEIITRADLYAPAKIPEVNVQVMYKAPMRVHVTEVYAEILAPIPVMVDVNSIGMDVISDGKDLLPKFNQYEYWFTVIE